MAKKFDWQRYALLMLLGVVLNIALHELASALDLPMWLDFTGTVLCAVALEPAAGLLVALINNFLLAIEAHSPMLILYYAAGASIALIAGLCMRRQNKVFLKGAPLAAALIITVPSLLSTALTLWESGGVSSSHWEMFYANALSAQGWPSWLALYGGVVAVKIFGTLAAFAIAYLIYRLLPKRWRDGKES